MQLNKKVMLGIVIGDILLIFLWSLIANITTPKVEVIENVEYIRELPKESYKIDLTDNVIVGKHYAADDYYFVVYNKEKNKGEDHLVKYDVWKSKEIGSQFSKGDEK